jgi:hypothetical protein
MISLVDPLRLESCSAIEALQKEYFCGMSSVFA